MVNYIVFSCFFCFSPCPIVSSVLGYLIDHRPERTRVDTTELDLELPFSSSILCCKKKRNRGNRGEAGAHRSYSRLFTLPLSCLFPVPFSVCFLSCLCICSISSISSPIRPLFEVSTACYTSSVCRSFLSFGSHVTTIHIES